METSRAEAPASSPSSGTPRRRQIKFRAASSLGQPRPASASLGQLADMFWLAGLFHKGGEAAALASEEVLRHFANGVVSAGVSLLLCQKLVAPALIPLSKARPSKVKVWPEWRRAGLASARGGCQGGT